MKHCLESDHGVPKFDCFVVIMCLFFKGPCKYFFLYFNRFVKFFEDETFVTFIIGVPRHFL